jgi:Zn-finger nucleic acid-binding protein
MARTAPRTRKRLVCPSCHAPIHFRPEWDDLGMCPRCGEWLVRRGRSDRHLERLDYELSTNFEESGNWQRSLVDEIG